MARAFVCSGSCLTAVFNGTTYISLAGKLHWDYAPVPPSQAGTPVDGFGTTAWWFDITGNGGPVYVLKYLNGTTGLAQLCVSARFRVDSSPALNGDTSIVNLTPAVGANAVWAQISPAGAVTLHYNTSAGGVDNSVALGTVSLDAYHTIDIAANASANPWAISASVDGGTAQTAAPANPADAFALVVGNNLGLATTGSLYVTHIVADDSYATFPIGQRVVKGYNVNATSGTHNQTAGDLKNEVPANITSGDGSGAKVSAVPPVGSTYVAQVVARSTTYWEGIYNTASETAAPTCVEQIIATGQIGTAGAIYKFQLYDGTSAADGIALTTFVNGPDYVNLTKCWAAAPSTGAWTLAKFQAARLRWGFATDVTPNPLLFATWLEAEFPPPVVLDNPFPYVGGGYYGG